METADSFVSSLFKFIVGNELYLSSEKSVRQKDSRIYTGLAFNAHKQIHTHIGLYDLQRDTKGCPIEILSEW